MSQGSIDWYQVLKDFQPFAAAMVALVAAAGAYISARTQARIALQTMQRQIDHNITRDDEAALRHQIAFVVMMLPTLMRAVNIIQRRLVFIKHLATATPKRKDGQTYDLEQSPLIWPAIANMKSIREEIRLSDVSWQDLSLVRIAEQYAFHGAVVFIDDCDNALAELQQAARERQFIHVAEVESVIGAYQDAEKGIDEFRQQLDAAFRRALPEYGKRRLQDKTTIPPGI